MDALLTNTQTPSTSVYPYWDFQVANSIVPILNGNTEKAQQATVISYTQQNLIPQITGIGVNWTGLMLGSESLSSIDEQIITGLSQASLPFRPQYTQNGKQIVANIVPQ